MNKKGNWRQLQDGFLWRLFVSYHKKTGREIPQPLTLCYYIKRLIVAAVRWFFVEKVVWIFSPAFFLWLGMLIVFILTLNATTGFPVILSVISVLFCFLSASIYSFIKLMKVWDRIETKISLKGLDRLITGIALIMLLVLVYAVFSDGFIKSIGESLLLMAGTIAVILIAVIMLMAVLAGASLLADKFIGQSRNWRLFIEGLKAIKKKICPIIFKP